MGHVRDLPKDRLAVDTRGASRSSTRCWRARRRVLTELRAAARAAETIILAADPDREGEAICWHLAETARRLRQALSTSGISRDHAARGPGGLRFPARRRRRTRRRAADPPRRRPAGRLQPQPAPVARRCGRGSRPGACSRWPCGSSASASARSRRSRPDEHWTIRAASTPGRRPCSRRRSCAGGVTPGAHRRAAETLRACARGRRLPCGRVAARERRSPRAALRHLDPAAGGVPPASLRRQEDDAGRAASLRGRRASGTRGRWGSSPTCGRTRSASRPRRSPRPASTSLACTARRSRPIRRMCSAPKRGAGSPRGDPADRPRPHAGLAARAAREGRARALPARLRPFRGLADGRGRLRRAARRRRGASSAAPDAPVSHVFRAKGSTLRFPGFLAAYGEQPDEGPPTPRRRARTGRDRRARRSGGGDVALPPLRLDQALALVDSRRAELHGAAAALHGGEPRQGARALRDRTALDLRCDPGDSRRPRLRHEAEGAARAHGARLHRHRSARRAVSGAAQRALHGVARGRARRDRGTAGETLLAALATFWRAFAPALAAAGARRLEGGAREDAPAGASSGRRCAGRERPSARAAEAAAAGRGRRAPASVDPELGTCPDCGGALARRAGRYGTFVACSRYPTCRYGRRRRPPRVPASAAPPVPGGRARRARGGQCEGAPVPRLQPLSAVPLHRDAPAGGRELPGLWALVFLLERATKTGGREVFCASGECTYHRGD